MPSIIWPLQALCANYYNRIQFAVIAAMSSFPHGLKSFASDDEALTRQTPTHVALRQTEDLVSQIVQLPFGHLNRCRKNLPPPPSGNICTHLNYAAVFSGDVPA